MDGELLAGDALSRTGERGAVELDGVLVAAECSGRVEVYLKVEGRVGLDVDWFADRGHSEAVEQGG